MLCRVPCLLSLFFFLINGIINIVRLGYTHLPRLGRIGSSVEYTNAVGFFVLSDINIWPKKMISNCFGRNEPSAVKCLDNRGNKINRYLREPAVHVIPFHRIGAISHQNPKRHTRYSNTWQQLSRILRDVWQILQTEFDTNSDALIAFSSVIVGLVTNY